MKEKEKINSARATLLIKVSTELFKLSKSENILINSISLSTIDSQYNYNNFEMNIENPLEIGNAITGISRSSYNLSEKKKIKKKKEIFRRKKYLYKRPKFLYRLAINNSNIYNILNQINDYDLNKIRKRKIISEGKFQNIETPKTISSIFPTSISQEKNYIVKQGLKYLRDYAKTLKDVLKCKNNRKSMKCINTIRLSVVENNVNNEKIKNTQKKESPPKNQFNLIAKSKSDENVMKIIKDCQYKNNIKHVKHLHFHKNESNKIGNSNIENNENGKFNNNKDKNNKMDNADIKIKKKRSITFILPNNQFKKKESFIINQNINGD